jgi:hypothetical protein
MTANLERPFEKVKHQFDTARRAAEKAVPGKGKQG